MLFTYLLLAFTAITVINCVFYLLFSNFAFAKHSREAVDFQSTSVIVYIKNQQDILSDFLKKLIDQSHPNFELVLVNNASYDDSLEIMEFFQKEYKNVHIVDVENNEAFWGSKKYALTLGVKKASHEHLLFITPTAEKIPENWIAAMSNLLNDEHQLVVGYENFARTPHFLSRLMRYNRFHSVLLNFGIASWSKPYIASENNLGYTSTLFYSANGFSNHMSIPTETENLFIKEVTNHKNFVLATSEFSRIKTRVTSVKSWFAKRKIHARSFVHFPRRVKVALSVFYASQLLFWIGAIAGGIYYVNLVWFVLIALRFLIAGLCIGRAAFKLGERDLFYLFPFLELANLVTQLTLYFNRLFSKSTS